MARLEVKNMDARFWNGKKVLVTGHTGFKGAWLSLWLHKMGAQVVGFALDPAYPKSLYALSTLHTRVTDLRGDIRDLKAVQRVFQQHQPDIVFHLAAQSLVRKSYDDPVGTIHTNTMGTVNMLECIRQNNCVKAAVLITSDKCYLNKEQRTGYTEDDEMGGKDPYSCSKACAEIMIASYQHAYFPDGRVASTRAGNVVGGGDWAEDRLVPDIIRFLERGQEIIIRNPTAVRPWQFVLEPLSGYLLLAEKIYKGKGFGSAWNFGPHEESMITVEHLAKEMIRLWGRGSLRIEQDFKKHEASLLYLDCSKTRQKLGWKPRLTIHQNLAYTMDWYRRYNHEDVYRLSMEQIHAYEGER